MEEEKIKISKQHSKIIFYFMLTIGLIGSFTIILLNIFRWTIVDIYTPFIAPFIEVISYLVFISCSVIVLVYFVVSKPNQKARNAIPLLINIIVIFLVFIVPFTAVTVNIDYRLNKSEREEVVQLVLDGTMAPNVSHNPSLIQLTENYKRLSKGGGEIVVNESGKDTQILFFTYRGVVDNYSGFIYTSNGSTPDETRFGDFIEVKKFNSNWYWVSAT